MEYRANQLELLVGGQVTGGTVTPKGGVRFTLVSDRLPNLGELQGSLGQAAIRRRLKSVEVEVSSEVLQRVSLPELIAGQVWPRLTAVLGIGAAGEAVTLDLTEPTGRSLLIAAPDEKSRQTLLRSTALSLLMLNRQRDMQLLTHGRRLRAEWEQWPHHLDLSLAEAVREAAQEKPGRPHLVVLVDTLDLSESHQTRLRQLLRSGGVSVIATAAAAWPGFPAQAQGGESPDEFRLTTGGQVEAMQVASATSTETGLVLARLRAGRKSRVWTMEETRPEKPGCFRRWFNPGRNRQ